MGAKALTVYELIWDVIKERSSWSMILEEPTQSQPTQLVQPENSVASENELVIPAGR
jgi:hypothetical protein